MSALIQMDNGVIQVLVDPDLGGRIASLRSVSSGLEFLVQSSRTPQLCAPSRNANFADGACAGIEECLPTVAACIVDGERIPDHGDFWQLSWQADTSQLPKQIRLCANGFSRPLRFSKTIALEKSVLTIHYRIENLDDSPVTFHFATHPLLAVEEDDKIELPEEVRSLTLYSSNNDRLGQRDAQVTWPAHTSSSSSQTFLLDRIASSAAQTAEMLYTGRLQRGWVVLQRRRWKQAIRQTFSTAKLPYLGLWICCGGWPASEPRQYAFAPEPTTAPCGSLAEALLHGQARILEPACSTEFSIQYEILNS